MLHRAKALVIVLVVLLLSGWAARAGATTMICHCRQVTCGSGWVTGPSQGGKYDDTVIRGINTVTNLTYRGFGFFFLDGLVPTEWQTVTLWYKEYSIPVGSPTCYLKYVPHADPPSDQYDALFDSLGASSAYLVGTEAAATGWHSVTFPSWGNWPPGYPISGSQYMVIAWLSDEGTTSEMAKDYG